jgi:uncharacterized delta-60 repeat protein
MRVRLSVCAVALVCGLSPASSLAAPAGSPDPSFGTGGMVSYQLGFGNSPLSRLFAVAPTPQGRIYVAGDAGDTGGGYGEFRVLSARLQENGSLDPSFGSSGYVVNEPAVGLNYPGQHSQYANAALAESDGSLVVAGNVIERLASSGQFDPSFGPVDGVVTERNALRQLPDGKLLILASEGDTDLTDAAEVERALPNGQPDPSFGKNGVTKLPLRPVNYSHMEATAETGVAGGDMIIAGKGIYYDASGEHIHLYLWIARLGPNGALDTSFGTNGFVYVEEAYADPEILLDGANLVLSGMSAPPGLGHETSERMVAWGFTPQGTPNPAFGNGGTSIVATTTGYNCGEFSAATVDPAGRLLLAGSERAIGLSAPEVPVLVRLSANGSLDTSFGSGGYTVGPTHTWFRSVAIDPKGRVLVAGTQRAGTEENEQAFVERFLSEESATSAPPGEPGGGEAPTTGGGSPIPSTKTAPTGPAETGAAAALASTLQAAAEPPGPAPPAAEGCPPSPVLAAALTPAGVQPTPSSSLPAPGQLLACAGSQAITGSLYLHWAKIAQLAFAPAHRPAPTSHAIVEEAMGFLISSDWVLGEAHDRHISVSERDVRRMFDRIRHEQFPRSAEFRKFLRESGQTISDVLLRVRLNLLTSAIQRGVIAHKRGSKRREQALSQFIATFRSKWRAQTYCAAAYGVEDCGHVAPTL